SLTGSSTFLADRLDGSGIRSLDLSLAVSDGDTDHSNKFLPGRLVFSGNVSLGGVAQLSLDASEIALVNTVTATDPRGCNVCLEAGYVALRGAGGANRFFPTAGKGVLQIAGGSIDIAAGGGVNSNDPNLLSISGAAKTSFISQGDIRLRVPLSNVPADLTPGALPTGELISAGDISMTAAQIYPASDTSFIIKSTAAQGTISFAGNGASRSAPLSAGGQLSVSAANIQQNGVLLAPLGIIRLGAQTNADLVSNDPTGITMVPTQSITFGAGSITSVSLNGQTVPFGQTANGASWSYDSSSGRPIARPPAKDLMVSGAAINLNSGAIIDLSGGGDLQAVEFVPGTGGTRDVLASGSVYAIIPGYNPAAAPMDLDFLLQRHDTLPAVGKTVYLSGLSGLPAGFYTLLPAHYATLPGAYRVAVVPGSTDALVSQNKTLPDGTTRMAGYFADSMTGARDARTQYFDVQSAAVWGQYSEIDKTSAVNFFGGKASASGVVPKLPSDAGHAVFSAASAIVLQGSVLSAPATNGRVGEMDIIAQDIQVLSPGAVARNGYVGLDATQLSNLEVDSLMLGGIRSDSAEGETVTMVSNSIEVSNDASAPLQRPEVILVTRVGSAALDPNANRFITLDAGSVVQ
ncbi:MAG: hypothetical protein JF591_16945, partial [Lysobacter sp.]|nr:hypothetical protein [Lysobacter sp.]